LLYQLSYFGKNLRLLEKVRNIFLLKNFLLLGAKLLRKAFFFEAQVFG
jgi:hypothetical protein